MSDLDHLLGEEGNSPQDRGRGGFRRDRNLRNDHGAEYRPVGGADYQAVGDRSNFDMDRDEERQRLGPMSKVKDFFLGTHEQQQDYKERNIYDNPRRLREAGEETGALPLWHHGSISATTAEERLSCFGLTDGLFLVAKNTLFVCHNKRVMISTSSPHSS
jgi:hypothetical protein